VHHRMFRSMDRPRRTWRRALPSLNTRGETLPGSFPMTPQNGHLANYSNYATIRMMSLWKCTTKNLVHMQHACNAGGINVVTLHKFTNPQRIYNITTKTPRVKIQIHTKVQIVHKAK
jgi:hypothetical protein